MPEIGPPEDGFFNKFLKRFTDESIDPINSGKVQFFERFIPGMRPEHAARYTFASAMLKEMKVANPIVIDAATGQGYGARIIHEATPEAKVYGVDLNPQTIKEAKSKYQEHGLYIRADVRHIPVENSSADMVTAFETLEHLPKEDQQNFLGELKRITKPTGKIIISIPYLSSTYRSKDNMIKHGFGSGSHLYEPTAEETRTMIDQAGLKVIGEFGQVIRDSREVKAMSVVNRAIPVWGLYAWHPGMDHTVKPIPDQPNITSLIHIFMAQPS